MFAALKAWHDSRPGPFCRLLSAGRAVLAAVVSGQLVLLTLVAVPVLVQSTGDGDGPARLGEMVSLWLRTAR